MDHKPVFAETILDAAPAIVWNAMTDKNQMKEWYFDLKEFKPEVGFEYQFFGEGKTGEKFLHICKIIEVEPRKKIIYSWRYEGYKGISFVTVELTPAGEKTKLSLVHDGLESFPITVNNDFAKENFAEGWNYIIGKALPYFLAKKI